MHLEVMWGAQQAELDGDSLLLDRAVGLAVADLAEIPLPPNTRARAASGGIGKGASGTGVGVVLEIAEHTVNDLASLIGIGYALRALISRVSQHRAHAPAGASASSLGALAAAESPALAEDTDAWHYARTVPLTTDGSVGTDVRDVWAAAFVNEPRGLVQLAFYSSSTRYLGSAMVATEWFLDGSDRQRRTEAQLAESLSSWFSPEDA